MELGRKGQYAAEELHVPGREGLGLPRWFYLDLDWMAREEERVVIRLTMGSSEKKDLF